MRPGQIGSPKINPDLLTGEQLVDHISRLTGTRTQHEANAEEARQAVVDAFRSGRSRTPPVLQRLLADAARITEGGVIAALKKDEQRKNPPPPT